MGEDREKEGGETKGREQENELLPSEPLSSENKEEGPWFNHGAALNLTRNLRHRIQKGVYW